MTRVSPTGGAHRAAAPRPRATALASPLLACGVLSSLAYALADLLGGLRYPGYSFAAQAISELGAIGAPSVAVVKPLFVLYDVLALLFGVGIVLHARHGRALRAAGVVLIAYGVTGLAVAPFDRYVAMHPRGSASLGDDWPHIALTGVFVALQLLATGLAASALGRRFRLYSIATVATLLVLGVVMGRQAAMLAAGEPTPVLGIIERVLVYAWMLWAAVLAVVLLRREHGREVLRRHAATVPRVEGTVAPGFEEVRWEFERNFAERGEIGGAVAAYWRGEKVVDLWGGWRTPDGEDRWGENTMVVVMSTTKGLAAMTLAVANSRGWLDYDASVAHYWP